MKTNSPTQLGMVGLGRMGANMVRRLLKAGHRCTVFDVEDIRRGKGLAAKGIHYCFRRCALDSADTWKNQRNKSINHEMAIELNRRKQREQRVRHFGGSRSSFTVPLGARLLLSGNYLSLRFLCYLLFKLTLVL